MKHLPPKRCVHVASVHAADDPRVLRKECEALAAAGFDVHLIARPPKTAPANGELSEAVTTHVVPTPSSRPRRIAETFGRIRRLALALDADVYHFHDPELMPFGVELGLRGKTVIYDVHEDYRVQVLTKQWIHPLVRRVAGGAIAATEAVTDRAVSAVVAATPDIASNFDPGKTEVVFNFPRLDEFGEPGRVAHADRPPWVSYVGTLYLSRGVKEMVEASGLVDPALGAQVVIGGTATNAPTQAVVDAAQALPHVDIRGWLDRPAVTELLAASRAGLVVLQPERRFMTTYPVKMFEYMAAGLPVIASDFPLWREIVERDRCGLVVDPTDPAAIARAIEWVLRHPDEAQAMGERGRQAIETRYNWDIEGAKLVALYRRLLAEV